VCGLSGAQVECLEDGQCCQGERCLDTGMCGQVAGCQENAECRPGEICSVRGDCARRCSGDAGCPVGHLCVQSACEHVACGLDGACPAGWEPVAGTLRCWPAGACPEGQVEGQCGLVGECVACNTDGDCGEGERCTELGECAAFEPCGAENRCSPGDVCTEGGLCRPGSLYQAWCENRSLLVEGGYCFAERCDAHGACPEGWVPVPGTLACAIEDCGDFGFRAGVCGLADRCVGCVSDRDCQGGLGCAEYKAECDLIEDYCGTDSECDFWPLERALCHDSHCEIPCQSIIECPYGSECSYGYCGTRACGQDGVCPDGWSPEAGTLHCILDPCSGLGLLTGACGLSGECVECNVDAECGQGICDELGRCQAGACAEDLDCPADQRCVERRCRLACVGDEGCGPGEVCDGAEGACVPVRCDAYGWCGRWGWQPVAGSLLCEYRPCYWRPEIMPGVCGLSQECVRCIEDVDCPAGEYCDRWGHCEPFHDCADPEGSGCANFQACRDGRCELACQDDLDCGDGTCDASGACNFVRCTREGTCPPGWHAPGPHGSLGLICLPD